MNSSQICLATTPFHDFSVSTMCAANSMCRAEDMRTALMEARGMCLIDEEENEFIPVNPWYTIGERVVRPLIDSGSRLVFKTVELTKRLLRIGQEQGEVPASTASLLERCVPQKITLTGPKAFYRQQEYEAAARQDFAQKTPLCPTFVYESQPTKSLLVRMTTSAVSPLVKIHDIGHSALGSVLLAPEDSHRLADEARMSIALDDGLWKFRRFSLLVDGNRIDAMLMGKNSTLGNGKWMLSTSGRSGFYECLVLNEPEKVNPGHACYLNSTRKLLSELAANVIYYNYPGVGVSEGKPSRAMMNKAHVAFLRFLESELHAQEIVDYGHSIGGVDQGDAWASFEPREGVKYVLVKDRTFKTVSGLVSATQGKILQYISRFLGWNMDSLTSSKKLRFPEVHVISVKNIEAPQRLSNSSVIVYGDARIPVQESLGMEVLRSSVSSRARKICIGVPEPHEAPIQDPTEVANAIKEGFAAQ